jgi:hypothetical protein
MKTYGGIFAVFLVYGEKYDHSSITRTIFSDSAQNGVR